jgi:glycosyltransferase involved in cell wall biosynthesis
MQQRVSYGNEGSVMSAQTRAKVLASTDELRTERDLSSADTIVKMPELRPGITDTIVIPAYNEEEGLPVVLDSLRRSVNGHSEVLVVDDGSSDATSSVASLFRCGVIRHGRNRGKGEAMKTGLRYAHGENVIFIDADGTYPTDVIPRMTEALESCDVVYCSRASGRDHIPRFNRLGNAIFQGIMRHVYRFKGSDYSTGLYGIKRAHLHRMNISSEGFAVEPEIAVKACRMNLRIREIPIHYQQRVGQSKLSSFNAGVDHLRTMAKLLFWRP